ncbi:MAG: hypothetical protein ABIO92_10745 [Chloroflexia bacterium]
MQVEAPPTGRTHGSAPTGLRRVRWWHERPLLLLCILFVAIAPLVTNRIYASDEIQYFAYTHSLFFDGDLDFSNQYLHFYESDRVKFERIYEDLYKKREPLTNLPLNVAPIGTGLLWLPSFSLAHGFVLAANSLGASIPADGYSQPYIAAICLTSYLLGCVGLLLCYSLARRYFTAWVAALSVVTMWLATPLIFYTVVAPPWSHATSLFAVILFLWYWDRTRTPDELRITNYELQERPGLGKVQPRTMRQWVLLGACAGLMMLVREQDALFILVPALEAVVRVWSAYQERMALVRQVAFSWVRGLVMMGVTAVAIFIPQLMAYRGITGAFGPSKVVTGKFNWTSPNFLNVLFAPDHGLVPWTPVVLLAVVGLVLLWRHDRLLTTGLAAAMFVQVYVAGSFLTWQSAGSFGQRRFINSTSIFVLGACALIAYALSHGVPKWVPAVVSLIFIAWNGGLLMQYALWCSPQRQGLDWSTVLRGQLEMPARALQLFWDYITDREKFYRSTRQC